MTLYEEALTHIDGYTDAVSTLDRVRKQTEGALQDAVDVKAAQRGIIDRLIADVIDGGADIPEDLGARLRAVESAADEASAAEQAIRMVVNAAEARITTVKTRVTPALQWLNSRLDALMDEVRQADRACGAIATAEQAVSADGDALDAWRRLQAAAGTYDELRQAQWQLLLDGARYDRRDGIDLTPLIGLFAKAGLYSNVIEWHPTWRSKLHNIPAVERMMSSDVTAQEKAAEWPEPVIEDRNRQREIWPTRNRPAFVRWLATSVAAPWVPTKAQMDAKSAEISRAIAASAPTPGRR